MKLKVIGPNQTELNFRDDTQVFFSYETPVAAFVPGRGFLRTDFKWSVTTSKHITRWLNGANSTSVPQSELDDLIEG